MDNLISKLVTLLFIVIMLAWAWQADKKFKNSVGENPFGDYEQPRTASVLGVLGTFLGISIGLLGFDPSPEKMHDSVVNLLGGMTTAFVTSIVGMGISLYFKNYQANVQKKFHGVKTESNIADLIAYLQKSDAEKTILLKNLTAALVGDGESTVTGQIKLLKADMRDEFRTLNATLTANNQKVIFELKDFGKTLAENNTKAFIEALNETMKDFNNKLTEQFGENFKQLNIAVGRLLEWQEIIRIPLKLSQKICK